MSINMPPSLTFSDMLDDSSSASDGTAATADDVNVEELTTQVAHWKLTPDSSPDRDSTQSRSTVAMELVRTKRDLHNAKAETYTLRSQLASTTAQHNRLLHGILEMTLDAIEISSPDDDDNTHPSTPSNNLTTDPTHLTSAIHTNLSTLQTTLAQNKSSLSSLRAATTAYKSEIHRLTATQDHTETVLRLLLAKYTADMDILHEAITVSNFRLDAVQDEAHRTRAELICAGKELAASAAMEIANTNLRASKCEEEIGRVKGVVLAMEGEMTEIRDELVNVEKERDETLAMLARVQAELQTANQKTENALAKKRDAESETALTLGKLAVMKVQLQDVETKLDVARGEVEKSRALEAGARLCLRDARGEVQVLEGRVGQAEREVRDWRGRFDDARGEGRGLGGSWRGLLRSWAF
ncbi:hypothetical protein B0T19DRAFT_439825 [Cercophora scortea]|uniref:Uncharacterized protein n=1 Tax=Cercophora scortea TaxID=314031 RepID=A0AAE0IXF8_9PEZI|nr:hypothetical protein B0T19DRAFT_439825 [Cercophora scortea]